MLEAAGRRTELAFAAGDTFAGALIGSATAASVEALIPAHLDMGLAMLAGMGLGMVVHVVFTLLLAPFLGLFHVMVSGGLIGMYGGMIFAMQASMISHPVWPGSALVRGALFGMVLAIAIDLYDRMLRTEPAQHAGTGE